MWNLNVKFLQRRFSHTEIPGTILHALILAKSSGGIKDNIKWNTSYFILNYSCFLAISSGGGDMAVAVGELSTII